MKRIWRFPIETGRNTIMMPEGAEILTLQIQRGIPCIWALVRDGASTVERTFMVYGTGLAIPDDLVYVGTFQLANETLVFHLFEIA